MNKKRNGFTLVELLVCFVLITIVTISLFKTVLTLQQKQQKNIAYNDYVAFSSVVNSTIQKDFLNKTMKSFTTCGDNCYTVTYTDGSTRELRIDKKNGIFTYGDTKEKIPSSYKFYDDLDVTNITSSSNGAFTSLLTINIPLRNSLTGNNNDIECSYQYNVDDNVNFTMKTSGTAIDVLKSNGEMARDNTTDHNLRYSGANPNNYVKFNNELWRIIGIFGDNIKIVRSKSIGNLSWDSSASTVNSGGGVNEWSQADLKEYLNAMYYGGSAVTCYNEVNNATTTCPTVSLNAAAKLMIDNHTWNTGALNEDDTTIVNKTTSVLSTIPFYNAERGTANGKMCTSGNYCTDTVERTTSWTGYVALPYLTDYAYASSQNICKTNIWAKDTNDNYICKNNNWMHHGSTKDEVMWTLSPAASSVYARIVWEVNGLGIVGSSRTSYPFSVFPTVYLKSGVEITGGSGTSTDPYTLKMKVTGNAVEALKSTGEMVRDNTTDHNLRYSGANPNNYVKFNDETWRVIGIFGNNIKIIRNAKLGNLSWDSSDSSINMGYGINEWSVSDLKGYLNTKYYGGSDVTCYKSSKNATTTCPAASLNETAKSMIDNHTWNTGAIGYSSATYNKTLGTISSYNAERGTVNGKICTSCTDDTITRTTSWTGYIGLPYITDYAYASSEATCQTDMRTLDANNKFICKNNNWMHSGTSMWALSPASRSDTSSYVWRIYNDGSVDSGNASVSMPVYPALYLKSGVKITGGSGTSTDPYILSM